MYNMSEKSERVDLVDANGIVMHKGVERSHYNKNRSLYPNALMQIVMAAVIDPDNRIAINERARSKSQAGLIDIVCETVQAGESSYDALVRGILEECGIGPDTLESIKEVHAGENEYGRHRTLYCVSVGHGLTLSVNPSEMAWHEFRPLKSVLELNDALLVDGLKTDLEMIRSRGKAL